MRTRNARARNACAEAWMHARTQTGEIQSVTVDVNELHRVERSLVRALRLQCTPSLAGPTVYGATAQCTAHGDGTRRTADGGRPMV